MNVSTCLSRPLACCLGFALTFGAAHAQTAGEPAAAERRALLAYDADKNGVLDATELAARGRAEERATRTPVERTGEAADQKVIELSPFQVNSDADTGYLATNTLSGTRLNSKLEDLGASITVITKQQMLDIAALDINDIFLYEAGTEGTGNFTAFSVDRNGGVNDAVQSSPQTANRIRGLDTANIARGNFSSNSSIPIDLYNTDAVELTRGPNSNIFGLGNASGTVNIVPSQANLTRESSSVTARVDSYGGFRGSVDLNRPLLRGKLGVRVSAVYQDTAYERKPSTDVTKRQQGTVTYKPFPKTTVYGTFEHYSNYARRPNSVTPRDTVTYWKSAGSPVWDPITQLVTLSNGATSGPFTAAQDGTLPLGLLAQGTGFYNRPSIYVDNGAVQFWSVNRTGSLPANGIPTPDNPNQNIRFLESGNDLQRLRGTLFPLYVAPGITDRSLYDWTSVNFVAPNYFKNRADITTLAVEQILFSTPTQLLAARGGWFREDFDSYSRNFIGGTNAVLYVDVNSRLLDGRPNPYFRRPYIGASEPTLFNSPRVNDIHSADLAYQVTPTRLPRWLGWIGAQKFAARWESTRLDTATYRFRDFVLDDHTWINPLNRSGTTASRAYYKYYVGDAAGQNVDTAPPAVYSLGGRYNLNWLNAATGQWVQEPATIGEGGVTPSTRTRREIRTGSVMAQNFFFNERIVTTFGLRKDKNRSRDSFGATIDPATALISYAALRNWNPWLEAAGNTKTAGVVVKPLPWFNVFFNTSDSFVPAAAAYNLYGLPLPNPTGKGKDYGIVFSLLDRKLNLKVNAYDTRQKNSRDGITNTLATRSLQLDTIRVNNGSLAVNFETWATNLATARFTAQGVQPTAAQTNAAVAQIMNLPDGFLDFAIGKTIGETSDVAAKGLEFELNYNPSRNWRFKATAAKQNTIDSNLSPNIQKYLDSRLQTWRTVRDDAGALWWTTVAGGTTPEAFYIGNISSPLKLAVANQGKPRSQLREWRFSGLGNYTFTEGRLKGLSGGGAMRWEDRASIGFRGAAPEADGVVRSYDPNKPVYDPQRYYFDLMASYQLRMFGNKIRASVQLNVRNVFENGRLQPVAVNPDGQPYAYRIIDPRQFILSTTFSL